MKQPTFLEGVAVALAASFLGAAFYAALTTVFPSSLILRALIAGIGLGYVVYLLVHSRSRVGHITALTAWALVAGATWFIGPPLALYVLVHVGLIWLIRSLYFYASVLCALADLGLSALSLAAAVWAAGQSGNVFLSIWCFFLVQALFIAIPARIPAESRRDNYGDDGFERAYRTAQAALRRLSSVR